MAHLLSPQLWDGCIHPSICGIPKPAHSLTRGMAIPVPLPTLGLLHLPTPHLWGFCFFPSHTVEDWYPRCHLPGLQALPLNQEDGSVVQGCISYLKPGECSYMFSIFCIVKMTQDVRSMLDMSPKFGFCCFQRDVIKYRAGANCGTLGCVWYLSGLHGGW